MLDIYGNYITVNSTVEDKFNVRVVVQAYPDGKLFVDLGEQGGRWMLNPVIIEVFRLKVVKGETKW